MDTTFWIMYGLIIIESIIITLARKDIIFFFKTKILKKKGYAKIVEMQRDRVLNIVLAKIGAKTTQIKDKTYLTSPRDVMLDKHHAISAIVVNETTAKSVGFSETGVATAQELSSLITQAKRIGAMGNPGLEKFIKIMQIGGLILLVAMALLIYYNFKNQDILLQTLTTVKQIATSSVVAV